MKSTLIIFCGLLSLLLLLLILLIENSFQEEKVEATFKCLVDQCLESLLELNLDNKTISIVLTKNIHLANCFYFNKYNSNSTSFAAIDICDQNRIHGWLTYKNNCYHVDYNYTFDSYLLTSCDDMLKIISMLNYIPNQESVKQLIYQKKRSIVKGAFRYDRSLFLELIFVIEYDVYKLLNHNESQVISMVHTVTNFAHALYIKLNLIIFLTDIIIEKKCCQIKRISSQFGFEKAMQYLIKNRFDVIILLSPGFGYKHIYEIVGRAAINGICTDRSIAKIKFSKKTSTTALIVCHEIGHLLGFIHVDKRNCDCNPKENYCIMSSLYHTKDKIIWSNCTLKELNRQNIKSRYMCLRNIPSKLYFKSNCGNGILEDGEECDCPHEKCSSCCIKDMCKLAHNSSCGTGLCCDFNTCQIVKKSENKRCRKAQSDCDKEEYCNGLSEFCPKDDFHHDGSNCGEGYCMSNMCQSHAEHCRAIWGITARPCPARFYKIYSVGTNFKFCRRNHLGFVSCKLEHSKCGLLYCWIPKIISRWPMVSFQMRFQPESERLTCAAIKLNDDHSDWKYTPNGAKCGFNSVCLNRECIKVNYSLVYKECSQTCNHTCICNDNYHCHCVNLNLIITEDKSIFSLPWGNILLLFIFLVFLCVIFLWTLDRYSTLT